MIKWTLRKFGLIRYIQDFNWQSEKTKLGKVSKLDLSGRINATWLQLSFVYTTKWMKEHSDTYRNHQESIFRNEILLIFLKILHYYIMVNLLISGPNLYLILLSWTILRIIISQLTKPLSYHLKTCFNGKVTIFGLIIRLNKLKI